MPGGTISFECPACCGGGAGSDCVTTCSICAALPRQFEFTTTGITNNACSNCLNLNGVVHTLTHTGSSCQFQTGQVECNGAQTATLNYNAGASRWEVVLNGEATYALANTSFSCVLGGVMPRVSVTNTQCNNYPTSITLSSVQDCEVGTGCCANTIPQVLAVSFTNKTGTCTCMPDSGTLTYQGNFLGTQRWTGTATGCTPAFDMTFECIPGGFRINSTACGTVSRTSQTCDPLDVRFSASCLGACNGTFTIIVTE